MGLCARRLVAQVGRPPVALNTQTQASDTKRAIVGSQRRLAPERCRRPAVLWAAVLVALRGGPLERC